MRTTFLFVFFIATFLSFEGFCETEEVQPALIEIAQKNKPAVKPFEMTAEEYFNELLKKKQANVSENQLLKLKTETRGSIQNKDYYSAISNLEKIIAQNPKNYHNWFLYLYTFVQQEKEYASDKTNKAKKIAFLTNKLATIPLEEAIILWVSGDLPESDETLKQQAVQIASEQEIKAKIDALIMNYPPKFAAYEIDKPDNQGVASACFKLTHPLPKNRGIDYGQFVSVEPALQDFRVSGRQSNLCIDGFIYGKDYNVILKPGIQSVNKLILEKEQKFAIYIDHRKPRLSFREKGYILPSSGPQILPLNTINAKEAFLELYHVPERGLLAVNPYEFLNNLTTWTVKQIGENNAEKIWNGKLSTDGPLNDTLTHGIPLNKLIHKQLDPGIYVLGARLKELNYSNYESDFSGQWFLVSDIGISTYDGPDGAHVFAHSLENSMPLTGVKLQLVSKSNKILGTTTTDEKGHGFFVKSLTQGLDGNRPELIFAEKDAKDFAFLKFSSVGFDFKDRGVQGRDHKHHMDGYLYAERGIYRPGEDVHFVGLLRDLNQKPILNEKITLKLTKPNMQEAYYALSDDQGAGSYAWDYTLPPSSPQGLWKAAIYQDPKGTPIAESSFDVNDFVPPKIDVRLHNLHEIMQITEKFETQIDVNYYYGAPGNDLMVNGEVELKKAETPFKEWKNVFFGFEEDSFTPIRLPLTEGKTDDKGQMLLAQEITTQPDLNAPLLLEAKINVFEQGGRPASKTTQSIIHHKPFYIGIKPAFKEKVAEGAKANFDIIAINPSATLVAKPELTYTLYEETHDFTWYRSSNNVNYENSIRDKVITRGSVETFDDKASVLSLDIKYGRYRVEVTDAETGIGSSFRFSSGWSYNSDHPDRPDLLDLQLDQQAYAKGDILTASIKSPFKGQIMILAVGQEIMPLFQGELNENGLAYQITLNESLCKGPGFYLIATALRPIDASAQQMPARAMGVSWVNLSKNLKSTALSFDMSQEIVRPHATFTTKLKYDPQLKNAFATVALVDEAVLNLTNYKSPDPLKYFSSQLNLGYKIFDSYGKLINPFGAVLNDGLVGGDGMFGRFLSILPGRSFKTISLFTGILPLDETGETEVSFDIPEFEGQMRLMAVLWSDDQLTHAEKQIHVRDEVVHDFALPRFLAPHDAISTPFMIHNIEGPVGTYHINIQPEGSISVNPHAFAFNLAKNEKKIQLLDLKANASADNVVNFTVNLNGPEKYERINHWQLSVRSPLMDHVKRDFKVIQPNQPITIDGTLLNGFDPTSSNLKLEIGAIPNFGTLKLSQDLQKYPYACLEQTASSIYGYMQNAEENKDKIHERLARLYALQNIEGGFVIWPDYYALDSFSTAYTLDLMLNLKVSGIQISESILTQGHKYLRSILETNVNDYQKDRRFILLQEQAYAHFVLAKAQKNALSQIRYFADNNKKALSKSMIASAFVGATYAYLGDKNEAFAWFNKAFLAKPSDYQIYGSAIRDLALTLSLVLESTEGYPQVLEKSVELAGMLAAKNYLSTQEMAWVLRASMNLQKANKDHHFVFNQTPYDGKEALSFDVNLAQLTQGMSIENKGEAPLFVTLVAEGKVLENGIYDKVITDKGFIINRDICKIDGTKITDAHFNQGELYVVVLKGEIAKPIEEHIVIADLLPTGFEIDNAHLHKNLNNYPWLSNVVTPLMVEGRDDRYVASFKTERSQKQFTLCYLVRASFKGTFILPAPYMESMYRPEFFGSGQRERISVIGK
ncbi:MAG: alpha-2-macroglobulin [Alphaproteobacteria bacterium]|nr:alpha-2-macroglobulin [Alphaproteobacteria bacterium]